MNEKIIPNDKSNIEIVNLGSQIHTVNIHRVAFGNDKSGRLIAYCGVVGNPAKLAIVDVDNNKLINLLPIKTENCNIKIMRGLKVFDNNVYMCGSPVKLFKYEYGNKDIELLADIKGFRQTFDIKIGENGVLIGATYNKSQAFEYDIIRNNFVKIGSIIDGEEYAYSVAYDEKHNKIYFGIATKGVVVEMDRTTLEKTLLPLPPKIKKAKFIMDMDIVDNLLFIRYKPGDTFVYDLTTKRYLNHEGENIISRFISEKAPHQKRVYYTYKDTIGYYDMISNEFHNTNVFCGGDAHGFSFKILREKGFNNEFALIGITQQGNMFKYNTETGYIKLYQTCILGEGTELNAIAVDNDDNIYVSGYLCGGISKINDKNKEKIEYTNEVMGYGQQLPQCDQIIPIDEIIYFSTYPNCELWKFDTSKKWDKLNGNPKMVYSAYEYGEQDRGVTSLYIKEKQLIAVGTVPKYSLLGGALVLFHTKTEKGITYHNISKDQSITSLTYKEGILYIGTHIAGGLGISPITKKPKVLALRIDDNKLLWENEIDLNINGISSLVFEPNSNTMWGLGDGFLFSYNIEKRRIESCKEIVSDKYNYYENPWRDGELLLGTDNNIVGVCESLFFKLDLKTKGIIPLYSKIKWLAQNKLGEFYGCDQDKLIKMYCNI